MNKAPNNRGRMAVAALATAAAVCAGLFRQPDTTPQPLAPRTERSAPKPDRIPVLPEEIPTLGCSAPQRVKVELMDDEEIFAYVAAKVNLCLNKKINDSGVNGHCDVVKSIDEFPVNQCFRYEDGFPVAAIQVYAGPVNGRLSTLVTTYMNDAPSIFETEDKASTASSGETYSPIPEMKREAEEAKEFLIAESGGEETWLEGTRFDDPIDLTHQIDTMCNEGFDALLSNSPSGNFTARLAEAEQRLSEVWEDYDLPPMQLSSEDSLFQQTQLSHEYWAASLARSAAIMPSMFEPGEVSVACRVFADILENTERVSCFPAVRPGWTSVGNREGCMFEAVLLDDVEADHSYLKGIENCELKAVSVRELYPQD
jgi:hypothetical protein